ncbi:hypothetical protein D3C80_1327670 [compost metagenome]
MGFEWLAIGLEHDQLLGVFVVEVAEFLAHDGAAGVAFVEDLVHRVLLGLGNHLAGAGGVDGGYHALGFHLLEHSRCPVVADLQVALHRRYRRPAGFSNEDQRFLVQRVLAVLQFLFLFLALQAQVQPHTGDPLGSTQRQLMLIALRLHEVGAFVVVVWRHYQKAEVSGAVDQLMPIRVLGVDDAGQRQLFRVELDLFHGHFNGCCAARTNDANG